MGSWFSKSSEAGIAYPEEPVMPSFLQPAHTFEPTTLPTPIKTKAELLAKFGPPTCTTTQPEAFFATCYEEDCFLMGGLRNKFTERMVWDTTGKSRVAYLRGDEVLKVFN